MGTRVWLFVKRKIPTLSDKLRRPWEGPYTILEAISDRVYKIRLNPRSNPRVVHRDLIVPYIGPNVPPPSDEDTDSASDSRQSDSDPEPTSYQDALSPDDTPHFIVDVPEVAAYETVVEESTAESSVGDISVG